MLDFRVVRVGFVRSLLWHRYGPFWSRLLADADADVVFAEAEDVARWRDDPRLDAISGRGFRMAGAEALALASCDVIVVPSLNVGYDGSRGSAQDPFVADLPGALATVLPGLPRVMAVPVDLSVKGLDTLAISLLSLVNPSPGLVRRVWQTHQAYAKPPVVPGWPAPSLGSLRLPVGLVGQPWNLTDGVAKAMEREGEVLLRADQVDPVALREEGWRVDEKLAPTDAEALGAVRRLARRSDVSRIRLVLDPDAGADAWLARRVHEMARRPVEDVELPLETFEPTPPTAKDDVVEGEA